jgi:hypothetical protein
MLVIQQALKDSMEGEDLIVSDALADKKISIVYFSSYFCHYG